MGTVRLDAAAVRALADSILDDAARLHEIHWPTMGSDALAGSSVSAATKCSVAEDRLADVVAHLRTWASAVGVSVAAIEQAEMDHDDRLGGSP
ncbi:DUF7162 family protein [Mycolicibacterium hodleri]|nr:hypothetical protein [Mycolicibacterium hodleri]